MNMTATAVKANTYKQTRSASADFDATAIVTRHGELVRRIAHHLAIEHGQQQRVVGVDISARVRV